MKYKKIKRASRIAQSKPFNLLSELNPNTMYNGMQIRKIKPSRKGAMTFLYQDLLYQIFEFIDPQHLIYQVQKVCKDWYQSIQSPSLWQQLAKRPNFSILWNVKVFQCLVERRSKGTIYLGNLRTTQEPVLLRKLRLDIANAGQDDGMPTSVLREIAYQQSLSHINIAKFYGAKVVGSSVFIFTESSDYNLTQYLEFLRENHPYHAVNWTISNNIAQNLIQQLLQGANYLHHNGIMHRNLKADNILISKWGELKITDFALSKQCSIPHGSYTPEDPKERDQSGRETKRLYYRAPELLLRQENYGYEVDIWSIGCLIAELILNEPLFCGETEIEQLFQIFQFLGTSDLSLYPKYSSIIPQWPTIDFKDVMQPISSQEYQNVCQLLLPHRQHVFYKLQKIGQVIGKEGLNLLQQCLAINPQQRITAIAALNHDYLQKPYLCCNFRSQQDNCQIPAQVLSYQKIENIRPLNFLYLEWQTSITESMRGILIDWLIDVSVHFELLDLTLHIGIRLIDTVLSKIKVKRDKLQLLGVTCLKIADVYNENSKEYYRQDNANEYAYITANQFNSQEVIKFEKKILNQIQFQTKVPTTMQFYLAFADIIGTSQITLVFGMFLADMLLLSYEALQFKPSLLAQAILFISKSQFSENLQDLSALRHLIYWHSQRECQQAINFINQFWLLFRTNVQLSRFEAVVNKYDQKFGFPVRSLQPINIPMYEMEFWWIS